MNRKPASETLAEASARTGRMWKRNLLWTLLVFAAALAWGLSLLEAASGAKVYCVGASLKQALETFDSWAFNIEALYPSEAKREKAGWKVVNNSFTHAVKNTGRILNQTEGQSGSYSREDEVSKGSYEDSDEEWRRRGGHSM